MYELLQDKAVPVMSTKLLWRGLLGLIILISLGGCSVIAGSEENNVHTGASGGPFLSFYMGGSEFSGIGDSQLSGAYRKDMTLRELLGSSGIAVFAKDGKSIVSVSGISLLPDLSWELQVNGKLLGHESWDNAVHPDDYIGLVAQPRDTSQSVQSVILFVDGAGEQPDLTHSYMMPFTEDVSVRNLLRESGFIQISEDGKNVVSVREYIPLSDEIWRVKVNGKRLMENGMDMKLRPQDEVELVLTIR